jgi:hypothetical protein
MFVVEWSDGEHSGILWGEHEDPAVAAQWGEEWLDMMRASMAQDERIFGITLDFPYTVRVVAQDAGAAQ